MRVGNLKSDHRQPKLYNWKLAKCRPLQDFSKILEYCYCDNKFIGFSSPCTCEYFGHDLRPLRARKPG